LWRRSNGSESVDCWEQAGGIPNVRKWGIWILEGRSKCCSCPEAKGGGEKIKKNSMGSWVPNTHQSLGGRNSTVGNEKSANLNTWRKKKKCGMNWSTDEPPNKTRKIIGEGNRKPVKMTRKKGGERGLWGLWGDHVDPSKTLK